MNGGRGFTTLLNRLEMIKSLVWFKQLAN